MKLPKPEKLFYWAAIAVLIVLLITQRWGCKPPDHSKDAEYVNQIKSIRDSAAIAAQLEDNIKQQDSARMQASLDSIKTQLAATRQQLNSSQRKTADLAAGVVISKQKSDTSGYIKNCDSLAGEIAGLNYLINLYVDYSDSLTHAYDSLQTNTATRMAGFKKLYIDEHSAFLAVEGRFHKLYVDYEKVSRKAGRKWGVGLGAGVGIMTDGKVGAAIGITVSRTIFRF